MDTGNYELLCNSLSNRLEPISGEMYSEIYKIKENMLENGADGAVMSGSGPTVYGLTQKNDKPGMYIMQSMVVVMKSILQDY